MAVELGLNGLASARQLELPTIYGGIRLYDCPRLESLVEEKVVAELKAVQRMMPVFGAQLPTFTKLGGWKLGLLFNSCRPSLKDGLKRLVL